jgi:hypothetical protein
MRGLRVAGRRWLFAAVAAGGAGLLAYSAAGLSSAGAAAPQGGSVAAPASRPGLSRVGGCPLFPASNIWNTDISRLPVARRSAAWLASMDSAHTLLHPDFGPNPGGYPFGIPFTVVTNAHSVVRLRFQYPRESDPGPYPFGSGTPIEGGKKAGGDRHAIMVNKSTCTLYELWHARYAKSGSTAGSGAIWNLRSNHLRPAGWTSADAAGLPILPGLLTFSQVQAAVRDHTAIRHAIRFTAAHTQAAYLWPARHFASTDHNPKLPPMGARFRLKGSFPVARFCASSQPYCRDAKVVLREMQHYGMILADNGSNWYFQGSAFPQWPDALVSLLKQIPASAFQAVAESCLRTKPGSGEATAKPGCPIG